MASWASVVGKVRTRTRALKRLEARVRSCGPLAEVIVLHAGAVNLAETLADLRDLNPDRQIMIEPAGSAVDTHLDLEAEGVCAQPAAGAG